MICYDKKGRVCQYCKPNKNTLNKEKWLYGMPRYKCVHPLEADNPINPDEICECPINYIRLKRKIYSLLVKIGRKLGFIK